MGNTNKLIYFLFILAVFGIAALLYVNNSETVKIEPKVAGVNEDAPERKVSLSPENQDLGKVIYGDIAETQFILRNSTADALKITRVSTSCSCTLAKVEKEELIPGEEIKVNVTFDPAVHKDDTDVGDIVRTIYIRTDNQAFPQLSASITANVVKK